MTVEEAIEKLKKCNPSAKLRLIQEEELECMPEWWDDEEYKVKGNATKIYSEDLYSHETYLLVIDSK